MTSAQRQQPNGNNISLPDTYTPSTSVSLPTTIDASAQLQNISARTNAEGSLTTLFGADDNRLQLGTGTAHSDLFRVTDHAQPTLTEQSNHISGVSFSPDIDLRLVPLTRCNNLSTENLSLALGRAFITFSQNSNTTTELPPARKLCVFNTALAWHIAEYRPTPVTQGKIIDVDAQLIYDALVQRESHITVRRIARAWSTQVSNVLQAYAQLTPPIFTTQCNDTFADLHDRLAVAPYFFDGVDPGTIPQTLTRKIATGLAYTKRRMTNSPYTFFKRPAFSSSAPEDLNQALQFNG